MSDITSPVILSVLTPLTASEMASATTLFFESYSSTSTSNPWDRWASYSTSSNYAILYSTFQINLAQGATYDIFSSSYLDPYILTIYDQTGQPLVANSEDNDFAINYDEIWNWVAPYTGTYYINASWHQGIYDKFCSIAVCEDTDTVTSFAQVTTVTSSGTVAIDALLCGEKWGGAEGTGAALTYSFPYIGDTSPTWLDYSSTDEPWNYTTYGFNNTQQSAAELAIQQWTNVAGLIFSETTETVTDFGEIRFAFICDPVEFNTWGWAYSPAQSSEKAGDIWVNYDVYSDDWSSGSYNFASLLHEIGHALGLKHPFEDEITLPAGQDSTQYSVMSYTEHPHSYYRQVTEDADGYHWRYYDVQPKTPMLYDIAAIQYLYGANMDYNTGNDIYTFETDSPFFMTIWDAGGTDTISVSNFTKGCLINLKAGNFSSLTIESDPLPNGVSDVPATYDGTDNLAIAYNVTIENAEGGFGNDILVGNEVDNTLDGREGLDFSIYSHDRSSYLIDSASTGYTVCGVNDGTDKLINIERLQFGDMNVALDLDGNAGETAKILGAVFGSSSLTNKIYVGIGLDLFDSGKSYQDVMQFALEARLGSGFDNTNEIRLLYQNLVGIDPSANDLAYWTGSLNSGQYTQTSLAIMAADLELNAVNINLVGLSQSGLEYS